MELILPHDFYSVTKDKFLLLDTSVFIDTLLNPVKFEQLFSKLKNNGCTLVTLDAIQLEFIKGSLDDVSFEKKKLVISGIVDSVLPISKDIWDESLELLKAYKEDGKTASVADLLLGGTIVKYSGTILLITKNLSDFPTNIYKLETHFNLLHRKGLHSYALLSFVRKEHSS
jgi:predicted nucleic acid-binding protein